jgi:uncharacterized membrane protein YfcA
MDLLPLGGFPLETFILVALLMLATGVIKMAVGGGGGPLLTPVAVLFLHDPVVAVVVMTLVLGSSDLEGLRRYWRAWDFGALRLVPPFMVLGTVVGLMVLNEVPAPLLRMIIGAIGVLYAVLHLIRMHRLAGREPRRHEQAPPALSATVGFIIGLFGTVANAGSIVLAMFMLFLGIEKRAFMGNMVIILFFLACLKFIGFASTGLLDAGTILLVALAYPMMILGGYIGKRLNERLDEIQFRNVLAGSVGIVGVLLLWP